MIAHAWKIKLFRSKLSCSSQILLLARNICLTSRTCSGITGTKECENTIVVDQKEFLRDNFTNVPPHILSFVGRNLHLTNNHPLNLLKRRLVDFMYGRYVNKRGNPLFSFHDKLSPIASLDQNFDSLLIPKDHVSRHKSDTYYIDESHVLRTHMSTHQKELLSSGLDNFIMIGDVYRRDSVDSTHFPVFHQADAVRLFSRDELFHTVKHGDSLSMFQSDAVRQPENQEVHTLEAVKMMESDLKQCLSSMVERLFGSGVEQRWTDSYFPFTHPSWELEVFWHGKWLELLGCGIMEQKILNNAGAGHKVGWAFGVGLERLAMLLYDIPDIRLFWSNDTGFLSQFDVKDCNTPIKYKPISKFPQCINDISFWVPENFHPNDFFEIVRSVSGSIVEQVDKFDEFFHPKHKKRSFSFRVIYRHMERTLTQVEVNEIHHKIEKAAERELGVEIR